MRRSIVTLLAPAALAGLLAGCGHESLVSPQATVSDLERGAATLRAAAPGARHGLFYPLALGNHWEFSGGVTFTAVPDVGPPVVQLFLPVTRTSDLMCTETRGGADYVVEHAHQIEGGNPYDWYVRYRQDRRGLYELDVATSEAPQCASAVAAASRGSTDPLSAVRFDRVADPVRRAAFERALARLRERITLARELGRLPLALRGRAGVRPGEIQRLEYPLVPGQTWFIRNQPGITFRATDEGTFELDTPAGTILAHRIVITADVFGPRDRVVQFFSRQGFVGMRAHLESVATDEVGNPIGTQLYDDVLDLQNLSLGSSPAL